MPYIKPVTPMAREDGDYFVIANRFLGDQQPNYRRSLFEVGASRAYADYVAHSWNAYDAITVHKDDLEDALRAPGIGHCTPEITSDLRPLFGRATEPDRRAPPRSPGDFFVVVDCCLGADCKEHRGPHKKRQALYDTGADQVYADFMATNWSDYNSRVVHRDQLAEAIASAAA